MKVQTPAELYPTITFLLRHGKWISVPLGLAPVLGALGAWLAGCSVLWLAPGLVAGVVMYGLARSYVELIAIIADMLLPR